MFSNRTNDFPMFLCNYGVTSLGAVSRSSHLLLNFFSNQWVHVTCGAGVNALNDMAAALSENLEQAEKITFLGNKAASTVITTKLNPDLAWDHLARADIILKDQPCSEKE